jgi:hypothetical protein
MLPTTLAMASTQKHRLFLRSFRQNLATYLTLIFTAESDAFNKKGNLYFENVDNFRSVLVLNLFSTKQYVLQQKK